VFIYSCIASAVTSLLFAFFARGYLSAFVFRGLMGLAVGGTYTPGLKLISESFPSFQRGRAMGFFIGGGSVGLAGSLAVAGWITARYGWQVSFFVTALGPVLAAVIASVVLKGMRETKSEPEERKFKKEIFANRPALLMIGSYSAHVWELDGMRAWTPAFLVACFIATGLGTENAVQTASGISSVIFMMGVFSTGIAGYLSDRLGRTTVIMAAMAVSILCSFLFGWLIGGWIGWVIILGLVYGFAVIAESPVFSTGLSEVVSPNYLGTALGFRSLVGFGVGSIVPTVFGAILDLTNPAGTKESLGYLPAWGWAFSSLGLVALAGPWMMLRLRSMPESLRMAGGKK
jgi:MFS family permease